jgi:hypothetical protein
MRLIIHISLWLWSGILGLAWWASQSAPVPAKTISPITIIVMAFLAILTGVVSCYAEKISQIGLRKTSDDS